MDADVIIIGAGAAGLAAARSLAEASLRVIVLEARDRAGGRAWSQPLGRDSVPAELGAEFIHGPAPQTMALLRETGAAAIDTGGETWLCGDAGMLERDDGDEGFGAVAGIFERARRLPEDESVETFLRRFAGDAAMRETADTARQFVEGFDAADTRIASAYSIADEWRSGVDSLSARPLGGYRPIFEFLHDACGAAGVTICLSSIVRRISWKHAAVTVDVQRTSGELSSVRARAAIVTLPVGVLRHGGDETAIAFEPDLPADKYEALRRIEMGHAVKVVLQFRSAFWERLENGRYRDAGHFRCKGQPFNAYWTQYPVRSELVAAWAGGPKATALDGATPAELIESALTGFGALFGELALAREELVRAVAHDWTHDPFARGAYSYVALGGVAGNGGARIALGKPVDDTLFFAGEATSSDNQGGTVNGALESGERAAREVAAALGETELAGSGPAKRL
jgi:monoamine oxidase